MQTWEEFGTDTFEIILKAKETKNKANFSLEGAKFRGVNKSTSYTENQITGIETTVTIKVETTEATNTENNNVTNEQVNNTVEPNNNVIENNIVNNTVNNIIIENNIENNNVNNNSSQNIVHINKVINSETNTTDKTTSGENELPQTGENTTILKLLFLSILLIVVNKIRVDRFKDIK